AEALLAQAKYEAIDPLETELKARSNDSRFLFQLLDVQGRRWKQQAPPNFEKAREYLRAAVLDPHGKGTLTAARCQTDAVYATCNILFMPSASDGTIAYVQD
ncbi:MAG: hypothetical protein ACKPJD_17010, partial [Planctomycetaceae bacterium]